MYPPEFVLPHKEKLSSIGIKHLENVESVDSIFNSSPTMLFFIDSVCGCSAGKARPAIEITHKTLRNKIDFYSVFAGYDVAATQKAREHLLPYPPSSPCIVLFKEGEIVHFLERHHIESSNSAEEISENLIGAFDTLF